MKLYRVLTFLFTSIATGLAAALIVMLLFPELLEDGFGTLQEHVAPVSLPLRSGPASYAKAVTRAAPSVVNVFASKRALGQEHARFPDPLFSRVFGDQTSRLRPQRENSLGSGVIIDSNGYILTNNHVIAGAGEIQVVLRDGRTMPARIVGVDPESDLAVLQAAGDRLPVADLGDSARVQVGDVVMAIGNPFGVGQTVTMGIVSATGRNELGITDFENFIQTDAAINPGNSGGALINAEGEVIGINTAMFSDGNGSYGIGFAIPVDLARDVLKQIAEHGHVVRGWIGVSAQELGIAQQPSFGVKQRYGLLVNAVLEGGPADVAGLQPGDLILAIDGERSISAVKVLNQIAALSPGTQVTIRRDRAGEVADVTVIVSERPSRSR